MSTKRSTRTPSGFFLGALPPLLSAAEERRLTTAYHRTRDPRLANRLVEANLRLVVQLARQHDRTGGRLLSDLVQEGSLGLMEAVQRFQPDRGTRLTTYAVFWIRAYLHKFMMDNVRMVRATKTRDGRRAFFRGEAGPGELSLEAPAYSDSPDGDSLGDHLSDERPGADVLLERAELAQRARISLARLESDMDGRGRAIVRNRLVSEAPIPLRRLAGRFSLSGERLRQMEQTILSRLRSELDAPRAAA